MMGGGGAERNIPNARFASQFHNNCSPMTLRIFFCSGNYCYYIWQRCLFDVIAKAHVLPFPIDHRRVFNAVRTLKYQNNAYLYARRGAGRPDAL